MAGLGWLLSLPAAAQTGAPSVTIQQPLASATNGVDATGPVLPLRDALRVARQNNPAFLKAVAAGRAAGAALRSAKGALLPQAMASLNGNVEQSGQTIVSGSSLGASSDYLQSGYTVGLTYQLSPATVLGPGVAHADVEAAEADVSGAAAVLFAQVAQQYVTVLEDMAQAALQDTLVNDARAQYALSKARLEVGIGTPLDRQRAEVALGQQQVQALQAHDLIAIDRLRLFQSLGVPEPKGAQLVDDFPVVPPTFTLDSVLTLAQRVNPQVNALRARQHADVLDVRRQVGLYTPTLQVFTGVGGYTFQYTNSAFPVLAAQQQVAQQYGGCLTLDTLKQATHLPGVNCGSPTLTAAQIASIQAGNREFPFTFQNVPRGVTAVASLNLFDGFLREQRLERAEVTRDTTRDSERARELQLTADVTAAYRTLTTALRTVDIQEQNAAMARQALALAEERYRIGAATFVDVSTARAAFERAESGRISSVYDYQKALAALESAVGRRLH